MELRRVVFTYGRIFNDLVENQPSTASAGTLHMGYVNYIDKILAAVELV